MKIGHDGKRVRLYAERKKLEAQQGNPIHEGVTKPTRRRIMREVISRSYFADGQGKWVSFIPFLLRDLERVFEVPPGKAGSAGPKLTHLATPKLTHPVVQYQSPEGS